MTSDMVVVLEQIVLGYSKWPTSEEYRCVVMCFMQFFRSFVILLS